MLTRAEDTDCESLSGVDTTHDGGAGGTEGTSATRDDGAGSVDGWAVVSVGDRSTTTIEGGDGGDDDDDQRLRLRRPATRTGFDLDPDAREGERGTVSSLSVTADEGTANGDSTIVDGDSFYGGYLGGGEYYEGGADANLDDDSSDDDLSVPDTVPSNVRSIRLEGFGGTHNAAGGFAATRGGRCSRSTLVLLAVSLILGSACTAYLAWDRYSWRQSALRLEAELRALKEREASTRPSSSNASDRQNRHRNQQVPPLFGEEEEWEKPEPSVLLDNCWVKATATVSLGACGDGARDSVNRASETVHGSVVSAFDAFRRAWGAARDATAEAAASGTESTGCGTSAASESVTRSVERAVEGLSAAASVLMSSQTAAAMSETLVEANEVVEETLHYLLDSARDAIEDSTVFLNNAASGGDGSFAKSEAQQQQQWDYGYLGHLVSNLFVNATSKPNVFSVDTSTSKSSLMTRFSDAMKRVIQDSASVDDEEMLL